MAPAIGAALGLEYRESAIESSKTKLKAPAQPNPELAVIEVLEGNV